VKLTPEAPLPTTSTSHAPAAGALTAVEIVVPEAAVFVATGVGAACTAPETEVEPAIALVTVPVKRTLT
jgi:hypothetical protein